MKIKYTFWFYCFSVAAGIANLLIYSIIGNSETNIVVNSLITLYVILFTILVNMNDKESRKDNMRSNSFEKLIVKAIISQHADNDREGYLKFLHDKLEIAEAKEDYEECKKIKTEIKRIKGD